MPIIDLRREFFEWRGGEGLLSDPGVVQWFGRSKDLLNWDRICERRRVVILAEAGSGKTEEMRNQARLRSERGLYAFFASVEDVDADGLAGALTLAGQERWREWLISADHAWFFIELH